MIVRQLVNEYEYLCTLIYEFINELLCPEVFFACVLAWSLKRKYSFAKIKQKQHPFWQCIQWSPKKKKRRLKISPRFEEASLIAQGGGKKNKPFNLEIANVSTLIGTTFGLNPGYQNFSPYYAIVKWMANHFV